MISVGFRVDDNPGGGVPDGSHVFSQGFRVFHTVVLMDQDCPIVPVRDVGLKFISELQEHSELIEDPVITPGGPIIDRDTIDPQTQKRYGYVQAVLTATNPFTGVLTLRKSGSVQVTPDKEFLTP